SVASVLLSLVFSLSSCTSHNKYSDPQKVFERTRSDYLRGHLTDAQHDADIAVQYFSKNQPEWEWKFRLLQGEILIKRGLSKDALELLAPPLPPRFAKTDLPIRQHLLQGLGYVALGQLGEAESSLQQAEQLSTVTQTDLVAEVVLARGILDVRQNRPEHAKELFRKA